MAVVDRPQEGSRRQVLKRPDWLIAQRIHWEPERRWEGAPVPQQPPHLSGMVPSCLLTIYFSLFFVATPSILATCCCIMALGSLERCKVCPQPAVIITSSLTFCHSLFIPLALVLFISLLSFSMSHSVIFYAPMCPPWHECSSCPFLARSWPLLCISFSPLPPAPSFKRIPHYSLRMGRHRRIICSPLSLSRWPLQECALVAQSYTKQKWSHLIWNQSSRGEVSGLERDGDYGCGGAAPIPFFFTLSAAF